MGSQGRALKCAKAQAATNRSLVLPREGRGTYYGDGKQPRLVRAESYLYF